MFTIHTPHSLLTHSHNKHHPIPHSTLVLHPHFNTPTTTPETKQNKKKPSLFNHRRKNRNFSYPTKTKRIKIPEQCMMHAGVLRCPAGPEAPLRFPGGGPPQQTAPGPREPFRGGDRRAARPGRRLSRGFARRRAGRKALEMRLLGSWR